MKQIKECEYIALDFFDTLVSRKSSPNLVKEEWAYGISEKLNYKVKASQILKVRNSCESLLYKAGEYTYAQLINLMCERFQIFYKLDDENIRIFKANAYLLEKNIEEKNLIINSDVLKIILDNKDKKKIIIVSDFYMDATFYTDVLKKLDIEDYIYRIYVSCDVGKSKRNGLLYEHVLNDLHINASSMVMVGDNYTSDFVRPREKGINAILLKRKKQFKTYHKREIKRNNNLKKQLGKIFKLKLSKNKYENYCFSLYLFIDKLYKELVLKNSKDVIFLSREGEFLKKLFDKYQENKQHKIKSHYLCVSRNSVLLVAMALDIKKLELVLDHNLKKTILVKDLMKTLTINSEECKNIIDSPLFTKEISSKEELMSLLENETLKTIILSKANDQYNNFSEYFQTLNISDDEYNIVDVGWNGSMQDMLSFIFKDKIINGYYVGLRDTAKILPKSIKYGLLMDGIDDGKEDIYSYRYLNFEQILKASHNRVNGYGKGEIMYDEIDDNYTYINYIQKLQDNIFKKFIMIDNVFVDEYYNVDDFLPVFKYFHKKMMTTTTMADYLLIAKCENHHDNGFGDSLSRVKINLLKYLRYKLSEIKLLFRYNYIEKNKKVR